MDDKKWEKIFKNKNICKDIPVIINADFGHTTPTFTFPIGNVVKITNSDTIQLKMMQKVAKT